MIKMKEFLVMLNQDAEVSELTANYMLYYFPVLLIYGVSDLYRKFLNSFRMNMIPFLSFTISVLFHPVWTYLFIVKYEMGMLGISLAGLITNVITFLIIKLFILAQPSLAETRTKFCDKTTFDTSGLYNYTALALPLISTCLLESWVWEQMTLSAGLISTEDQAV
jgi:multidrug resistance protein, MATE family